METAIIQHNQPTVSVVLCTYNGERYLAEQLDTILNQTYPIHEIIVQDDGSTDGTMAVLQRYAAEHSNIHVFVNQDHRWALNSNFFSALRRATGDFIAISDQDDIWELDKIATQMAEMGDNYLSTHYSHNFTTDSSYSPNDNRRPNYHLMHLMYSGFLGHTILMRRDFFESLPMEHEIYDASCYDVVLAMAAAAHEKLTFSDHVLVHHRKHAQAQSTIDYSDMQPTVRNAAHILSWSLRNYREASFWVRERYKTRLSFLKALNAGTTTSRDAIEFCEAEVETGLASYLRLTRLCYKHRRVLFWTVGDSFVKKIGRCCSLLCRWPITAAT